MGEGFFNILLVLSFLLSNLGGISIPRSSVEIPSISWVVRATQDRFNSWIEGLKVVTITSDKITINAKKPTETPTERLEITPTPEMTSTPEATIPCKHTLIAQPPATFRVRQG